MNNDSTKEELSVLQVIQDIKNGLKKFTDQDDSIRKEIVNILRGEGYSQTSIAQILRVSDKTIYRIILKIKKDNQVSPSPEFVKETVGEMCRLAYQHWCSLTRIAKNQSTTTKEKIAAEAAAWGIIRDYIEQLRRIGYLPSAAQEVIGKFSHQIDGGHEKSWQDIQAEVNQLVIIAQQTNVLTPELQKQLLDLNQNIEKAKVQDTIQTIISKSGIDAEDIGDAKGKSTE